MNAVKAYCTDPARSATHARPGPQLCLLKPSIFPAWAMSRKNVYDGIMEYWVTVREHGSFEEEHEVTEKKRSASKAAGLTT